ncbi:MAG: HlyD family efflux transporter periplasmic adaptor subunit, partial [Clostridia bacterium]|nr:HlyD family efflux transporter periplasmic adaptor subunit [Clostridia bacterium]
ISDKQAELSEAESKKGREPDEIKKDIEAQEDSIRELKEEFEILEASEGRKGTESTQRLELQKKEIEELEKKIKEYENAPENTEVLAPIAGRVVSVSFVPGDTVTSGNTVASIEIADKGYVVEISMPAEEARRIQVGSPCTVTNSWWYSNITASVAQVRSDPKSQGKNRIIVINVSGDVSEGQSLNFSIGDRSQSYDSVLPNSAIREDNDGKFVLTVEAKKTPLGNRYVAKRTNVEILASDDTQSAVSGLYGSEFVITSSTTPITDGQQVRLAGD